MFKLYSNELKWNYSWWSSREWVTLALHCAIYSVVITPRVAHLGCTWLSSGKELQESESFWWPNEQGLMMVGFLCFFFVFFYCETKGGVGYLAPGPMWTRESVAQLAAAWLAEESKGHHRKFSWLDPSQSGSSSLEPTREKSHFPLDRTDFNICWANLDVMTHIWPPYIIPLRQLV